MHRQVGRDRGTRHVAPTLIDLTHLCAPGDLRVVHTRGPFRASLDSIPNHRPSNRSAGGDSVRTRSGFSYGQVPFQATSPLKTSCLFAT
jgi:hypothetical protein